MKLILTGVGLIIATVCFSSCAATDEKKNGSTNSSATPTVGPSSSSSSSPPQNLVPRFSGIWLLDKDKSEGLRGPIAGADSAVSWFVTQDESQVKVQPTVITNGRKQLAPEAIYKLDGAETPGNPTRKARWVNGGKTLEVTEVAKATQDGKETIRTTTYLWELEEKSGRVLKIRATENSSQGIHVTNYIFTWQQI